MNLGSGDASPQDTGKLSAPELQARGAALAARALSRQAQDLDFSAAAGYDGSYRHAFSLMVSDGAAEWTGTQLAFLARAQDGPQYARGLAKLAADCSREHERRLKLLRNIASRKAPGRERAALRGDGRCAGARRPAG